MSYQFKGIDIANIVDTTSSPASTNFANVYQGLPYITYPNYTNSNLLSNLGYTDANGSDLSTVCAAIQQKYNYSQSISVPTGANQFRYFIIGGSGGGGGGGGCANNGGWQQSGGSGGDGGFGYTKWAQDYCSGIITIIIGTGGAGGGGGGAAWQNESGTIAASKAGGSGGSGNATNIVYDNTSVNVAGGLAGGGGGAAAAYRSNYYKDYRAGGGNGQTWTPYFDSTTSGWNPTYVTSQSGGGGGQGGYNISMGGAPGGGGQSGYAVIVWLYD